MKLPTPAPTVAIAAASIAKTAMQTEKLVKSAPAAGAKSVAAIKPVVKAGAAIAEKSVATVQKVVAVSSEAAKTSAKDVSTPIASLATMLPKPPEFAALTSATMMTQALGFARTFSALQASMLDHACSELKAKLGEVETLARTDSPADAVALQAKALRRGFESYAAHLRDLAQVASASLRKG